jgi:hypothetical protein
MKKNNTGNRNSGNFNSGDFNSGNRNSGNLNSGDFNSGDRNSGNWNSGDWNSGNQNSGNLNSGNLNSGDFNSGKLNSGDFNSGDFNSGDFNSGYFNTNSPDKVRIFNTWVEMTHKEFNEKYNIYADLPLNRWVDSVDMTDEEKEDNSGWEQRGGFLRTLEFKEACRVWWSENPGRHKYFLELPNFDAKIFEEITGIDVNQEDEVDVTVEGNTVRISRKSAIALGLIK